jgi:glycosyltransferase involved in cell wall biosynthesis
MVTRLAAVFSHPIQYFAPLFRVLARDPALDLKVLFGSAMGAESYHDAGFGRQVRWDVPLLEGYDNEVLVSRRVPLVSRAAGADCPRIGGRLGAFDPDVVWVHGYASLASLRAMRWARGRGRAVIFTGDSELLQPRSLLRRAAKRLVLPALFRRVAVVVDFGERNREYYRHYGVPDAKLAHGALPLEIARFAAGRESLAPEGRREAERVRLGLDPRATTVVWSGKFAGHKRPVDLIGAIALLRGRGVAVQALFVGSGPLGAEMECVVADLGLERSVRFSGFVNQAEMPRLLALGDVVAMTSEREPYGLAIPEAMAAGNAVVASDRVGCVAADGVARPGVNALVYPWGDAAALAAAIGALAGDPARLAAMREASRGLAWQQDVSRVAVAVREAAVRAHRGGPPLPAPRSDGVDRGSQGP